MPNKDGYKMPKKTNKATKPMKKGYKKPKKKGY